MPSMPSISSQLPVAVALQAFVTIQGLGVGKLNLASDVPTQTALGTPL